MAADEKTEKATPKKRRDQRKEGNVFKSTDVANVVFIFASFYALKFLFPGIRETVTNFMTKLIGMAGGTTDVTIGNSEIIGMEFVKAVVKTTVPFMFICCLVGILGSGVQTKFLFASKNLRPKFSNLNPIEGIKKLFSLKNVVELIKNLLKVTILVIVLYTLLKSDFVSVARTMDMDILVSVAYIFELVFAIIIRITLIFVVIALFDYMFQWWEYERKIKMSKQEVKEEFKQTEGNPEIKSKIKEIQRQRARTRMMQAVPEADVIIRNPTHYAVALKYDMDHYNAPVVVAKGVDELALRIVKIGEENSVAVIENKPLARGLYAQTELNQEIPAEYYSAVAEILVYVYKMNKQLE